MFVYVISKEGKPLMPTKPAVARLLLKACKAKVIRTTPFIIKMLEDTTGYTQPVVAGMDTGSKTIGCAAVSNTKVVYQSEVQLRTDVSKKMEQRRMYRRTRRSRKTRYRPARWSNRASMRCKGRLAPSLCSKIEAHLREKMFVESILPVSKWVVELASFDIHKITNPEVQSLEYQEGSLKGFYNVKAYILDRDKYLCQKCKKKKNTKLHVHHIIYKSKGGTDTPSNLITLCEDCHEDLHKGLFEIKCPRSKTKHATAMGIIKSQIQKQFGIFTETYGYETKFKREQILNLPKTHYNDAVSICCETDIHEHLDTIYYKRCVSKGDYQQTKGSRSEVKIPTGKLLGLRKFDKIKTSTFTGFVKGKRSSGRFAVCDINWKVINPSVDIRKSAFRLSARTAVLIERGMAHSSTEQAVVVSCAS